MFLGQWSRGWLASKMSHAGAEREPFYFQDKLGLIRILASQNDLEWLQALRLQPSFGQNNLSFGMKDYPSSAPTQNTFPPSNQHSNSLLTSYHVFKTKNGTATKSVALMFPQTNAIHRHIIRAAFTLKPPFNQPGHCWVFWRRPFQFWYCHWTCR